MLLLGLTGSIGMGKSTTADMFRAEGAPVYDSDRLVHDIYDGPAAMEIEPRLSGATAGGAVDRNRLASLVLGDAEAMKRLEAIVHPLVWEGRRRFLEEQARRGVKVAVARHSPAVRDRRGQGRRRHCRGHRAQIAATRPRIGASEHDGGKIRIHPGAPDARRRERRRAISSFTPTRD